MKIFHLVGIVAVLLLLRFISGILFLEYEDSIFGNAMIVVFIFGTTILAVRAFFSKGEVDFMPTRSVEARTVFSLAGIIVLVFLITAVLGSFEHRALLGRDEFFEQEYIFRITGRAKYFLTFLIVAPIFYELFYNGILLPALLRRFDATTSIVLKTVVFVGIQVGSGEVLDGDWLIVGTLSIVFLSLFTGWVMVKTGNIWVTVLLHFLWNASHYLFPLVISVGLDLADPLRFYIFSLGVLLISVALFSRGILFLKTLNRANALIG